MTTTLPFRKLYIDSRWCTQDSVSPSNFKVQIPYTMQLPDNTVFFVTDVCIPHSWQTVEQGFNDQLFLLLELLPRGTYQSYVLTIAAQNYTPTTFITELQRIFALVPGSFSVTADNNNGAVIKVNDPMVKFKLCTDDDVVNERYWNGAQYNVNTINSANDIINNNISTNTMIDNNYSYNSGFLTLNWINNIYITSPNLGSFDTLMCGTGQNNIIKKVPVLVNYGYMVIDQLMSTNDFLDCSKQTLQTLEFHLKTAKGAYVPLHNSHVSFSIVFNRFGTNG